jgi:GcrA cell cycle regulator
VNYWTAPRLERLKVLAGQGLSAGIIASRLSIEFEPVTRNAVIGKLMRGKGRYGRLSPRLNAAQTERVQTPARGPSRVGRTGAAAPHQAAPVRSSFRSRPCAPAALASARAPAKAGGLQSERWPAAQALANLPAPLAIAFLEAVERGRCLHFVGDPLGVDGPGMPVCGAERAQDAPFHNRYCARHRASSAGDGTSWERKAEVTLAGEVRRHG